MQRLLAYVLAMGCVGTSAAVLVSHDTTLPDRAANAVLNNDAAFRDGLYMGKLAQAENRTMRPPVGRWSSEKDRASFAAGFQQALDEQLPQQK